MERHAAALTVLSRFSCDDPYPLGISIAGRPDVLSLIRMRVECLVHETIRALARDEARSSDTIRGFAAWCGIHN